MTEIDTSVPMSGASYTFKRLIARGGMAELWTGEASSATGAGRRVALKRILTRYAHEPEYLDMFLSEAQLALQLQHQNIVHTLDVTRHHDSYVIVMELLDGADLYQLKRMMRGSGKAMTLSHVLYVVTNMLSGLHYAHELRDAEGHLLDIVHRDISPQNIFLTYDGGVKLLDFGIAKTKKGTPRTESGVLKGKVRYMSPEQCNGSPIDRRSDVYSVGVVLYQLLTGTPPHTAKSPFRTMKLILENDAEPPHKRNPRVDAALSRIVLKALAKKPEDRYATGQALQEDLLHYIQERQLFMAPHAMGAFVESVLGPRGTYVPSYIDERPGAVSLTPADDSPLGPQREEDSSDLDPDVVQRTAVLFDSPCAAVRRVGAAFLLELKGTIDERFDPSVLPGLLTGDVLVDSNGLTRITSFGIRQMLTLFEQARAGGATLYHVRCSVAWMSQVSMIRNILGGGRILSFHAPYLDGIDNRTFSYLLQGDEARAAVLDRRLPRVPSPSNPAVPALFDDDPEGYFDFREQFQAETPKHLEPVLDWVEKRPTRRMDVEIVIGEDVSTLHVRTPLHDRRWQRAVQSLEGAVRIDLTVAVPAYDIDAQRFIEELDAVSEDLSEVRLVGAPAAMVAALVHYPLLRTMTLVETVQVGIGCRDCGAERLVCVRYVDLLANYRSPAREPCTRCGGGVAVTSPLDWLAGMDLGGGVVGADFRSAHPGRPHPIDPPERGRNATFASNDAPFTISNPIPPDIDPAPLDLIVPAAPPAPPTVHRGQVPGSVGYLFVAAFAVALLALTLAIALFVIWPA